jgi:hypothetical protein
MASSLSLCADRVEVALRGLGSPKRIEPDRAWIGVCVHGDKAERPIPRTVAIGVGQHIIHVQADKRRPVLLARAHDSQMNGTRIRGSVHTRDRAGRGIR